jgi:iron complex outermembrane receptor protein
VFDRAGNAIPGVPKQTLNLRAGYDIQSGALRGIGAFIETSWRESAFADNANLMRAPGYTLLNLNAHYDPPEGMGALSRVRFYISARNLADRVYVSSASNVSESISATTGVQNGLATLLNATGSIYAGQPRTIIAGVKVKR